MREGATPYAAAATPGSLAPVVVVLVASGFAVAGMAAGSQTLLSEQIAVGIAGVGLVLATVDALLRRGSDMPWRTIFLRAAGVGILVLPVFVGLRAGELPPLFRLDEGPPGGIAATPAESGSYDRTIDRTLGVALAILTVALVVWSGLLAALLRRARLVLTRRRRDPDAATAVGVPVGGRAGVQDQATDEALRRSVHAMDDMDDARKAVIAAYVALEQHLESGGVSRDESETAREFVTRALVQNRPADRERVEILLQVFEAARFSHRPITQLDVQKARDLLAALVRG